MHPLLQKLLRLGRKPDDRGKPKAKGTGELPKGMAVVRRGKSLKLVGPYDLGPGWAQGKHPGSKKPLSKRVADRRRRNRNARRERRRQRLTT